ncbi:MAG: tetratricopeptide repeat protein [Kaiparowitsia implicata GSE-PSE-MK54-09C]|jgi:tetratricopeptide (TPR) repeat protein|nr:tetratricopeptide repeat protein [Kaiparowitsia implicata GSE-PSE-MK54-09C]
MTHTVDAEEWGGPLPGLTVSDCERQLKNQWLTPVERSPLLIQLAQLRLQGDQPIEAIAHCDAALQLQPDASQAYGVRGLALMALGQWSGAAKDFNRAIAHAFQPAALLWGKRGEALRNMGQYKGAIACYTQALTLQPNHATWLSAQGSLLAVTGQPKPALAICERALALQPDLADAWNSKGVALLVLNRLEAALGCFDQAIALDPKIDRTWCNRGTALVRLERYPEAIESLERSLTAHSLAAWHAFAWTNLGYAHLRQGEFQRAIAPLERALQLQPRSYTATLYRLACIALSGQLVTHLRQPAERQRLRRDSGTILNFLKLRLLVLGGVVLLITLGQGAWAQTVRDWLPLLLSAGIVGLVGLDLWVHRSRLRLVWRTYIGNSWLTYLRALGTVVLTLVTYTVAESIAPRFLLWGWGNLVFGQPGNVIFQPLSMAAASLAEDAPVGGEAAGWSLDWAKVFILLFWGLMLLGIPLWARLEERIFRRGGDTWRQIAVRSTQFGLIHLVAGIPILGGLVLILPGFLFACRYKTVRDRTFRQTGDLWQAQEAGVTASTADHAVYNAILVSLAVFALLMIPS